MPWLQLFVQGTAPPSIPLLSELPPNVYQNHKASKNGSLVVGLSTPGGKQMSLLDAVVGKVRG